VFVRPRQTPRRIGTSFGSLALPQPEQGESLSLRQWGGQGTARPRINVMVGGSQTDH
jgi:hypothetical protein